MGTMFDTSSDPREAFGKLQVEAIAAYGNGSYHNSPQARAEYPHVPVLEIDVTGAGIGDAGDFERFDIPFSQAGRWAKGRIDAGVHRPVVYFSVGTWPAVKESLEAAGLHPGDVRIWTAHYTGEPHLCSVECGFGDKPGDHADATQWGSAGIPGTLPPEYDGHNIDVSMTADNFW
jgi:hypothetical protein